MSELLSIEALETCYGSCQALFGVNLQMLQGEFITLLGRNGMGKSTTVKSIMGLISPKRGTIRFKGRQIHALPSYQIARQGIGLVPEGRHIFPNLTVRENLIATAHNRQQSNNPWTLERIDSLFPRLRERRHHLGSNLSGGEQQMLAIGRALMTNPQLLILDEATEGLAPLIRSEIWNCLSELKHTGLSVICIDKNLGPLTKLADMHYILEKGLVVWKGNSASLNTNLEGLNKYLSV
ncbi:ABC transporter ATP-binding protein [Undibacterium sp.]|jgi:branched-chain amino acid transport system ATP-binding protein|uniref:ABC transporter ATP-binding protein n=1 Tax=Undibacterium sp. TaxID=1914977 RepID=UPI002C4FF39B|nr:ABC transporter ATP-binding protein [Undibacterium sp.]HTD03769.1 ABC transporter ATP-binding protein [Undibacterium sp.]